MAKGLGLYSEIGKKARDLLFKDYQSDPKFTITTTHWSYYNVGQIKELVEESKMAFY